MSKKNSEKEYPPACLLGRDPEHSQNCQASWCFCCGWNSHEARMREILFAAKGLTMCSDGLRRLVMPARNDVKEETK